ncbi:Helix-turn-helix domain-containing protein [Paraburkholderia steynii]|uniref:Helix-turn-helix domain-containing protein n=1 Tax=Paraburkholderia steynii TaxID=1245441 RepID=A0A7Z7BAX5_9BURK|nr:Helix-turn-helix domain-containing protein [Paraburkholderia steynii]
MYHETGNAGLICARRGISRPTLRKWLRRYRDSGKGRLRSQSRRPLNSPDGKVIEADRARILRLRSQHKGARRIQNELRLHEQRELSLATIHKVLNEASVKPLVRPRQPAHPKRYSRPIPEDRAQMDTMKIARGACQYTAIDDCSRFRVLAIYRAETLVIRCFFLIVSSRKCRFRSAVSGLIGTASSSPNRYSDVR